MPAASSSSSSIFESIVVLAGSSTARRSPGAAPSPLHTVSSRRSRPTCTASNSAQAGTASRGRPGGPFTAPAAARPTSSRHASQGGENAAGSKRLTPSCLRDGSNTTANPSNRAGGRSASPRTARPPVFAPASNAVAASRSTPKASLPVCSSATRSPPSPHVRSTTWRPSAARRAARRRATSGCVIISNPSAVNNETGSSPNLRRARPRSVSCSPRAAASSGENARRSRSASRTGPSSSSATGMASSAACAAWPAK